MKKIIVLVSIIFVLLFVYFVPVIRDKAVFTNCGIIYIPGDNRDCNFYSYVTIKDFLLYKILK